MLRRLSRLAVTAIASVGLASSISAQEQTGSLQGIVRDTQGGVLPGVFIEVRNLGVGSLLTLTTDGRGEFRLAAVPPGYYDVTATLSGFRASRFPQVEILLGQIKQVDFDLAIGGLSEEVNVAATAPLIDVQQSARGFSLRQEQLTLLRRGLDFTAAVPLLPAANNEPKLGGLSIDGSSAAENLFIVDGVNTTQVMTGLSGYSLNVDSIDELQVKSSGYTAEFGGSTGGVINVVTRSGTNTWRGDGRLNISGSVLDAGPRPTLRKNLQDSSRAEYVTYQEDPYSRLEPGGSLGGKIVRDHAWFFVAYQPDLKHEERTVSFAYDGSTRTFEQTDKLHKINASQNLQLGPRLRTRAAFNAGLHHQNGLLPDQAGADTPTAQFDIGTNEPGWSVSDAVDWLSGNRWLVTGRVGYFSTNTEMKNVRESSRYVFTGSNFGLLDVPVSLQRVTGFATETPIFAGSDLRTRLGGQLDTTWFAHGAGEHSIKAGIQIDRTADDVNEYSMRPTVLLVWNSALQGQRGVYGYYFVRSDSLDPRRGPLEQGYARGNTAGLFVQDAWRPGHRLSINAGLRSERERVPSYSIDRRASQPIVDFSFADKLAPRVGVAWDVAGDGHWKVSGSWGVFYDTFKYLVATNFGAAYVRDSYYTLDTYQWPTLLDTQGCPPACPGRLILGPFDEENLDTSAIDPELRPTRLQEATIGTERQVSPRLVAAVRYVHKQLDRVVEDIGALDASFNEVYSIGNPGFGQASVAYPGVPLPKARRDYDALEISVRRPLSGRWSFDASYVWSRLWGNLSGLSQSDEEGRVSPNLGRAYDYPAMMFDQHGHPVYGPLATDRPHQMKLLATWVVRPRLTASVFEWVASGLPITREAAILPPSNFPVFYLGRLSDGRTPVYSQNDVSIEQELSTARRTRLSAGLSVSNLFNQKTIISVFPTETDAPANSRLRGGAGIALDEAQLYAGQLNFQQLMAQQGVPRDPRFLMARTFQSPRSVRVLLKLAF
jgi:hypothetical protein